MSKKSKGYRKTPSEYASEWCDEQLFLQAHG